MVFGCGGDRDKGKRPIMGKLAAELADICWVTSDNPRTEDPLAIVEDVLNGMPTGRQAIHVESDRAEAILSAYKASEDGDLLVVAGKGHENVQIIGNQARAFSDSAVARATLGLVDNVLTVDPADGFAGQLNVRVRVSETKIQAVTNPRHIEITSH